jgi:organic radical activating enzyme
MDMKPSSSTGDRSFEEQHEEFLEIALQKETFVKVVVSPETKKEEIERCIEITAKAEKKIPFIFQPLSDPIGINQKSLNLIEKDFFELAKTRLEDVRVIPQMHKIWGVR